MSRFTHSLDVSVPKPRLHASLCSVCCGVFSLSSLLPLLLQVPELAGFLLLSFLIQLPLLLFLLTDEHIIRLPLETAVHIIYLVFLASEITAAFFGLKVMTRQLATQFYLKQFEDAGRPWQSGHSMSQGRAAHPGRSGQLANRREKGVDTT